METKQAHRGIHCFHFQRVLQLNCSIMAVAAVAEKAKQRKKKKEKEGDEDGKDEEDEEEDEEDEDEDENQGNKANFCLEPDLFRLFFSFLFSLHPFPSLFLLLI